MEMELKSKQEQQLSNEAARRNGQPKEESMACSTKVSIALAAQQNGTPTVSHDSLDENNNDQAEESTEIKDNDKEWNNGGNSSSNGKCSASFANNIFVVGDDVSTWVGGNAGEGEGRQQVAVRSDSASGCADLSPQNSNCVPTAKSKNRLAKCKAETNGGPKHKDRCKTKQQQVSAELLCQKLSAYEASGEVGRGSTVAGDNGFNEERVLVPNFRESSGQDGLRSESEKQAAEAAGCVDESQLMSIDPTLCHARSRLDNTEQDARDNQQLESCEEQIANEDFSSSNSSFGPMSISIPNSASGQESSSSTLVGTIDASEGDQASSKAYFSDGTQSNGGTNKRQQNASISDEEDQNSTQSGSVLTVINAKTLDRDDGQQQINCQMNDGDNQSSGKPTDEEEDAASNIGVAFESLQFDDEIKSSKNELVDEEHLLGVPTRLGNGNKIASPTSQQHIQKQLQPAKVKPSSRIGKFNSQEVKSVCNFITSAISDATKQVESCMKSTSSRAIQSKPSSDDDGSNLGLGEHCEPRKPEQQQQHQRANLIDCRDDDDQDDLNGEADERAKATAGIQRAKFVRQESNLTNCEGSGLDYGAEAQANTQMVATERVDLRAVGLGTEDNGSDKEAVPIADLSSIFEANVRREIERFESKTMLRKQQLAAHSVNGGKTNGLTEWRIAEEIRQFNEREKELKLRTGGIRPDEQRRTAGLTSGADQKLECVVRFGKTLQIPKSTGAHVAVQTNQSYALQTAPNSHQTRQEISPQQTKSIKLSASSKENGGGLAFSQGSTMISMHKFISSGGKRFVYTSVAGGGSSACLALHSTNGTNSSTANTYMSQHDRSLTKSMSNLSTNSAVNFRPPVDYRAVDSFKCKETPNVEPGIAKKTIETFSRMSSESSSKNDLHQAATNAHATATSKLGAQQFSMPQPINAPLVQHSAEWKIQEELRDMRAREAELRALRCQQKRLDATSQNDPVCETGVDSSKAKHTQHNVNSMDESRPILTNNKRQVCDGKLRPAATAGDHDYVTADNDEMEHIKTMIVPVKNSGMLAGEDKELGDNGDSLYPIKHTIDSFRRLNSSCKQLDGNNNSNGFTNYGQHHSRQKLKSSGEHKNQSFTRNP